MDYIFEHLLSDLRARYPRAKADAAFVWFHENHSPEFKRSIYPLDYIRENETVWSPDSSENKEGQ